MNNSELIGKTYQTKTSGTLKVIAYNGNKMVSVRFTNTGHERTAQLGAIQNGMVKDPMHKSFMGVGIFGVGEYKSSINGSETTQYKCWSGMMKRCYCPATQKAQPTYVGCKVCDSWHNFQNFAKWYDANHPNDGGSYHLDKDVIIDGNKTYSPEACSFISLTQNNQKAQSKKWRMTDPSGVEHDIYNMTEFCATRGLEAKNMRSVHNGKRRVCQGWTKT